MIPTTGTEFLDGRAQNEPVHPRMARFVRRCIEQNRRQQPAVVGAQLDENPTFPESPPTTPPPTE